MNAHHETFCLDSAAELDPSIQPLAGVIDLTLEPQAILLTGATGFVGAYLLRELLEQTQAVIYCLVRAETPEQGEQRIRDNLSSYRIWNNIYGPRIIPVLGDLKLPLFGLDLPLFWALAETIDTIYHCGSKLSYIAPYHYLSDANVGGTQEALRLATLVRPKPLHFVSSLGILLAYKDLIGGQETDKLDATKCPEVGYFQTKYVSEKLVRTARERGIPVTIHRLGLIVGDSHTGASNVDDFVARVLIGCIEAGFAPDVTTAMDMTPVDYVAKAMVFLSHQKESCGKVFHLLNPHPIHWSDIFSRVSEAGYPVHKLDFQEWVTAIEVNGSPATNPLYPLLPFFHVGFAKRMLGISDSHFGALGTQFTQAALSHSNIQCPRVDQTLVNIFLSEFVRTGRLSRPAVYATASTSG